MKRKWGIMCVFFLICILIFCNIWKEPEIVSCITTVDTTYITILLHGMGVTDKETTAQEVVELCIRNGFKDIKFSADQNTYFITIYRNVRQLKEGDVWFHVMYNFKEKNMNIL